MFQGGVSGQTLGHLKIFLNNRYYSTVRQTLGFNSPEWGKRSKRAVRAFGGGGGGGGGGRLHMPLLSDQYVQTLGMAQRLDEL